MAYIRNFRGSSGNRAIISGSNVQVTGSLFGSAVSGTTAQFTSITGTLNGNITGNAATVTNGIYTTNIATNATTGVTAGNGLTGGGTTGVLTLNVGAGTGISVAADTVGIDNTVVATLGDNQTFTSTKTYNAPSATSTSSYVAEFRNSSTTNNASRFIWSQASTYALAVNVQGTAGTSATTDLQWINRSTGATQSTPITLNYNGDVTIPAGNLVIGTSGKGISFGSTTPDGTNPTSELFDDYEKGTFTPTVFGGNNSGTKTGGGANGVYIKIGKLVYIKAEISWTSHTGTGGICIGGFPFTPEDNVPLGIWFYDLTYTSGGTVFAYTQNFGYSGVALYYTTSGATITAVPMDTNGATIIINGCYSVA